MSYRTIAGLAAIVTLTIAASALAESTDDWRAGQTAYQQGDYASALLSFQSARDSGLDGPAVHYNIAVCHFKTGDLDKARQTFILIVDRFPEMRGLAEYNLGLIARRTDDMETARQHFLRAYQQSANNETVRILASRMLGLTEPEDSAVPDWNGAIGLRVGHDDNIALRDEFGLPAGQSAESPFADFFASVQGPWPGQDRISVDGNFYLVRYFDADDFDQSEFRGRVFYSWQPNSWQLEFGVHASSGYIGGDSFDRRLGLGLRVFRDLGQKASVDVRYNFDDVSDTNSLFAGIDGTRHQFDARYRWYIENHGLLLRYRAESNDRSDPGVSPTRSQIGAEYRYQPDSRWIYEAGVYVRSSSYDDLLVRRDEDLLSFHAGLSRSLPDNWFVSVDYRYSDNDSSDVTFSYSSTQISTGLMKIF